MIKLNKLIICFIIFAHIIVTYCDEDYYKILGVPRNADDATIKKAFKKLSLKYHPDKNKDNSEKAKDMFVKVANSYETLIDPEKRKIYDSYGEEGIKKGMGQQQGGGFQGGNFEDIFKHFWGGQGGQGGQGGGGNFQFHFGGGQHQQHQQQQQQEQHEDFWTNSDVIGLTMADISKFYRRNEVWIVLFYKSNDRESKIQKDLFRDMAEKLYGIIKVAGINCISEREEALCEDFSVYDVPKVLVFSANYRADPVVYTGAMNFNSLSSFAINQMESFVLLVNDENYESFVKEHFDKPIVLSFTQKKSTPALLKALSKDFKGKLVFGEVRDSNKKLIQKFKIHSFPTIMVLTDPDIYEGVQYANEMKKDQIMKFLREYAYTPNKLKRKNVSSGVLQMLTPSILGKGQCGPNDNTLCSLLIVNKHSDNKKLLETMNNLADIHKGDPINFFYVFTENINYSDTFQDLKDFPELVILKTKRNKYIEYEGELEQDKIKSFIEMVVSGSGKLNKMKGGLSLHENAYADEL